MRYNSIKFNQIESHQKHWIALTNYNCIEVFAFNQSIHSLLSICSSYGWNVSNEYSKFRLRNEQYIEPCWFNNGAIRCWFSGLMIFCKRNWITMKFDINRYLFFVWLFISQGRISWFIPTTICGVLIVIAGMLCLTHPETRAKDMKDQV